jgi:hypothetical protein
MSVVLTEVPFVVDGATVTPHSETVHAREETIPRLRERSERIRERAAREGKRIDAYERTALSGDDAFANTPLYEALYDHGFYGAFEPPGFPERHIEGKRLVTYRRSRGGELRSVDLDACSDGVHFCECEAHKPQGERTPMEQRAGRFGKTGEVSVICRRPTCLHRGHHLYIPFRRPDKVMAGGRREAGPVDYTRVNPLWRGDRKVAVLNWRGRQTIEHYHQQRYVLFGLGDNNRRSGRRFLGDAAYRLFHTLGDLLWNLTVLENLERGIRPEVVDVDVAYHHMLANGRNVAHLRSYGRRAAAEREERRRKSRSSRGRFKRSIRTPAPASPAQAA